MNREIWIMTTSKGQVQSSDKEVGWKKVRSNYNNHRLLNYGFIWLTWGGRHDCFNELQISFENLIVNEIVPRLKSLRFLTRYEKNLLSNFCFAKRTKFLSKILVKFVVFPFWWRSVVLLCPYDYFTQSRKLKNDFRDR